MPKHVVISQLIDSNEQIKLTVNDEMMTVD